MKKFRPLSRRSVVVSPGATSRTGDPAMTRLCIIILPPMAAVALVTLSGACGSYSAPSTGSAGSNSATAGASGSPNGSAGTPAGAGETSNPGGNGSGGSVDAPTGGSGGTSSGGASGSSAGGVAGSAAGGASGGATGGASGGPAGGANGTAGAAGGSAGAPSVAAALPCEILKTGGNTCVSAHSTVRVIVPGYTGPLYQLCKGTANAGPASCKGTAQDVASKDGYADSAAHDAFCTGATCAITKIYDQSGKGNHLEPAPAGGPPGPQPDNPANAGALKVTINGHAAYGILIKQGIGYRTGCSGCTVKTGNGMVTGDAPESMYWVTSAKDLIDGCCFDYGNAETTSHDDGNGTMETLYFGGGVVWGTGAGGKPGPWMMADLENGLYAGWNSAAAGSKDQNIPTNTKLPYDFVTGVLLGDTRDKNSGKGRFAIYGGDATMGTLKSMYDGIRPEKSGYVPMTKQGSIILGIGGDNSKVAGGRFYEGAISTGPVLSQATVDALQVAIVAAKYGK